jgi:hypothetical protein
MLNNVRLGDVYIMLEKARMEKGSAFSNH